jgi:hypothetical protein
MEPAGLKVLHYLLDKPNVLNGPYRDIAAACGVGLATVAAVITHLRRAGYIQTIGRGIDKLLHADELVEIFVQCYAGKLRPELFVGRFRAMEQDLGRFLDEAKKRLDEAGAGRWGVTGGFAAREMTKYYRADALELMLAPMHDRALREAGAVPDRHGPITVLRFFPGAVAGTEKRQTVNLAVLHHPWPLATPLLVYAELIAGAQGQDDPRMRETAGMIYEQDLKQLVARHG